LSPWETASNQDEWPHPVASPGILTDNLRHPLSPGAHTISPGFRAKPQLSSVFVIKRNHPGLNLSFSFLPVEALQNASEISCLFSYRDLAFRSWDNSPRGIRGFLPRVALSIILDKQYVNRFVTSPTATVFLRSPEKHFGGEKEKWANEHADAPVGSIFTFSRRGLKRECILRNGKDDNSARWIIICREYFLKIFDYEKARQCMLRRNIKIITRV